MTNFIGTQLTKKGLALIAKSGLTVTFTKAETGSGTYDEKEDISTMTELKEKKQSFSINSALKKTETQANVKFVVSNKELTEGYLFTEIGLYALDPDEGEILYAVCYSTPKNATELQAYNGVFEASVIMSLLVDISNDGNVVIDPQGVYALEEDLCVTNEKLNHIADCLGDHTIKSNVPENAKFTDTTYEAATTKKDGLMSVDDKNNLEELLKSYIDNTLPTGTDFNNVTTEGRYYMHDKNTYTNKPSLVNGFVDVKVYGQVVKQIIWRQGTIGTNDHDIYERTGWLTSQNWSDWVKILTAKDLTTALTVTTIGSPLDATVAKDLNDKITAINTRLGTGNSSAYMTVNTSWSGTNVRSIQINQLHKVGKMVELDLALTFKVEQAAGVKPQIGTISSGILPRCEISVLTNSFAPNATNPNGTASAELRITSDGKVYWYNSTASSIPANGGMKAHAVWITN